MCGNCKRGKRGYTGLSYLELQPTIEVEISSAQILAMGTTPIELLPVLPSNQYYEAIIITEFTLVTAFTTDVDAVLIGGKYFSPTFLTDGLSAILNANYSGINATTLTPSLQFVLVDPIYAGEGVYLSLFKASGTPTIADGEATALAKIWYKIRTLGSEL